VRLVSYMRHPRGLRAGVLREDRVVDAWDAMQRYAESGGRAGLGLSSEGPAGLRQLLPHVGHALEEAIAAVPHDSTHARHEVSIETPLPDPEKIICIGLNYRPHAEEAGVEAPAAPTFFAKFRNALVPSGAHVPLPASSKKVDFEAEVAFVLGRFALNVPVDEALDCIAGYTLFNDLSARDLQFSTPQWMPGKVFDGSAPCGPAIVTPDEAGAHDSIDIELTLNGETMQKASTAELIFSIPELLAHLSSLMTLMPGDIVSTGTPSGVGSVREPRVWLAPGDEIVVSSPSLGRLETTIAATPT
jgi:2-keto-4-pentenoate hydratase/2-oxohepta-3-ene-1,7-dioic acid hydratase in catechol pathway